MKKEILGSEFEPITMGDQLSLTNSMTEDNNPLFLRQPKASSYRIVNPNGGIRH